MVSEERDLEKLLAADEPRVDTASGLQRFRERVAQRAVHPYRAPRRGWSRLKPPLLSAAIAHSELQ